MRQTTTNVHPPAAVMRILIALVLAIGLMPISGTWVQQALADDAGGTYKAEATTKYSSGNSRTPAGYQCKSIKTGQELDSTYSGVFNLVAPAGKTLDQLSEGDTVEVVRDAARGKIASVAQRWQTKNIEVVWSGGTVEVEPGENGGGTFKMPAGDVKVTVIVGGYDLADLTYTISSAWTVPDVGVAAPELLEAKTADGTDVALSSPSITFDDTTPGAATATITANDSPFVPEYNSGTAQTTLVKASESFEGSGSQDDPYLISTPADLGRLMVLTRNEDTRDAAASACYKVTKDINYTNKNLPTARYLFPVGARLSGHFDGDSHTINLAVNTPTEWSFFGYLADGATIENLTIGGTVNITYPTSSAPGSAVFARTGSNNGTFVLRNCANNANVTSLKGSVSGFVADVIGNWTFERCVNNGNITAGASVSGLVWRMSQTQSLTLKECANHGNLTGSYAGGIGYMHSGSAAVLENVYNTGTITATAESGTASGFFATPGSNSTINLKNAYNAGTVSGGATSGAIGSNTGTLALENVYYLDGTAGTGGNNGSAIALAAGDLQAAVTNNKLSDPFVTAPADFNNGYPVFSWELENRKTDIADTTIKDIPDQLYTGEEVVPSIKKFIQYDGATLAEGTDYELSFENNVEVGTATMTITGIGAYAGSVTKEFQIIDTTLTVYAQTDADSAKMKVGTYTLAQMKEMAADNVVKAQYGSNSAWTVFASSSSIALSDIFDDLGITVSDENTIKATASDGFSSSYTWGQINGASFYGDSTSAADFGEATETVVPSIVLTYAIGTTDSTITAAQKAADLLENGTQSAQLCPRIFVGIYDQSQIGGNRFASSVNELTIVGAQVDIANATIRDIYDQSYTGEPQEPAVTVRYDGNVLEAGTDYTVTYENNTEIGTATATITGIGGFTGSVTKEFQIAPFFTLYYKKSPAAEPEVAAQWKTQAEFEALAKTEPTSGMMFTWTVLTSSKYVTVSDILAAGDVEIADDDTIAYAGRDGWGRTRTWSAVNGNFYPNAVNGHSDEEAEGAYATPAVIALNYTTTSVNPDAGIANAKAAEQANIEKLTADASLPGDSSTPRFITGVADYNFSADNSWEHWGWTQGSMIASLTVTTDGTKTDIADATIKDIPEQLYTGEEVIPSIKRFIQYDGATLAEGTDYELSFENNVEVGTATMTIKGIGAYTGSVTKEFQIIDTTLDVYVQADADSEKMLVGSYTLDDLKALAADNTVVAQYGSNSAWTVFASSSSIALTDIFDDLGITVSDENTIKATASDGFSSSYTWGQINGASFYGDSTSATDFGEATETVAPSIVLTYAIGTTDSTITAAQKAADLLENGTQSAALCPRIFVGIYDQSQIGGNRFASSVNQLTIVGAQVEAGDVTVEDVTYAAEVVAPPVTINGVELEEGTDYTIAYFADEACTEEATLLEVGTYYAKITGNSALAGESVQEFHITHIDVRALWPDLQNDNKWYMKDTAVLEGTETMIMDYMAGTGLITGSKNADGSVSFLPGKNITRGQLAVILCRAAGEPAPENPAANANFSDLKDGAYYVNAVNWAYENHVVNGSAGKFRPNDNVTRQEFAAMLANYAEHIEGIDIKAAGADVDLSKWTDGKKVSGWAQDSVKYLCAINAMGGSADLKPASNATRAEASKMVAVLMHDIVGMAAVPADE